MQKGKQPGGQHQAYPSRNNYAYPPNSDNTRHFARPDVGSYQIGGNQGLPMRGLHPHGAPHPGQSSTPPTPQDLKAPHMPPQAHQMAQQQGQIQMWNPARNNTGGQGQYYQGRPQPNAQRNVAGRQTLIMPNNSSQSLMQSAVSVQQVYTQMVPTPLYVPQPHLPQTPYQMSATPRSGIYQPTYLVPQQTASFYPGPYTQNVFYQPPMRAGSTGPVPQPPGGPPPTAQPGGAESMSSGGGKKRRANAIPIIDPGTMKDVSVALYEDAENGTPPRSGDSSSRQTPQPSCGNPAKEAIAADFAARVAIAAVSDDSSQQPSSRTSNYSESDSQPSPDPHAMSPSGLATSKMVTSVDNMGTDNQLVENNIGYEQPGNPPPAIMSRWMPGVEYVEQPMPGMHVVMGPPDVVMRGGPPPPPAPAQPPRDFGNGPWAVMPDSQISVIINKEAAVEQQQQQQQQQLRQERGNTPVVSALIDGPTVDITPRQPVMKGPNQSPSRRKPRVEHLEQPPLQQQLQQPPPPQPQVQPQQQQQVQHSQSKDVKGRENLNKQKLSQGQASEQKQLLVKNDNNNVVVDGVGGAAGGGGDGVKLAYHQCDLGDHYVDQVNSESVAPQVSSATTTTPPAQAQAAQAAGVVVRPASPADGSLDAKTNKSKAKKSQQQQQQQQTKSKPVHQLQASDVKRELEVESSTNEGGESVAAVEQQQQQQPQQQIVAATDNVTCTSVESTQDVDQDEDKQEDEDKMVAAKNEENNKQTAAAAAAAAAAAEQISDVIDNPKVVLRHNYKDDQWSPLNPAGKKKYERDFLLDLQNDPQSKRKPENLPDLDLLRDNSLRRLDKNYMARNNDILMPSFANKSSSLRGVGSKPNRGSQQGNKAKSNKSQIIHMSLSLHEDVKLNETENAWKPARVRNKEVMNSDEIKTDDLYKKVRGVLNKLTPQMFQKLVEQVKCLPIDNCSRLQGVIDLVFEKAVDEPSYSVAYAHMCQVLASMDVPAEPSPDTKPGQTVNFKKLMVARCQREFENKPDDLNRETRLKEIADEPDADKKKEMLALFEEDERRVRMKSVGNIRFIGELFKLDMLTRRIMFSCITTLFEQGGEESLECLCKLLTTVGKNLDDVKQSGPGPQHPAHKDNKKNVKNSGQPECLGPCFDKLKEIVATKIYNNEKVSSRVRFMIQDVIDLRDKDWVPRRDDSNPKTIDQIQKEAERESMESTIALSSPLDRNKRQDSRNSLDRKNNRNSADGWTTVIQNKAKYSLDPSKLRMTAMEMDLTNNLSLGPQTQFTKWNQGAVGSKGVDIKATSNKFSILEEKTTTTISRVGSSGGGGGGGAGFKPLAQNVDKERVMATTNFKPAVNEEIRASRSNSQQGPSSSSRSSSRDSVSSKGDEQQRRYTGGSSKSQPPPTTAVTVATGGTGGASPAAGAGTPPGNRKLVTKEELSRESRSILDEYIFSQSLKEVYISLEESFDSSNLTDFCYEVISLSVDKSLSDLRLTMLMLEQLLLTNRISSDNFLTGFSRTLEIAEDLAIDIPHLWDMLAELLAHMLLAEVISFKDVLSTLQTHNDSDEFSAGLIKLLSMFFKIILTKKDAKWVRMMWDVARVDLGQVITDQDRVDKFVKDNNLESVIKEVDGPQLTHQEIGDYIHQMLTLNTKFDEVIKWIDLNVGERRSEPEFVRQLTTVILKTCMKYLLSNAQNLVPEVYVNFLKRYIDGNEKLELACLHAIQAFDKDLEHPKGLLVRIFDQLLESNVIPSEAFLAWRDCTTDPQEGKGVAVKALTSFFTHLSEPDASGDDS